MAHELVPHYDTQKAELYTCRYCPRVVEHIWQGDQVQKIVWVEGRSPCPGRRIEETSLNHSKRNGCGYYVALSWRKVSSLFKSSNTL